MRLAGYTRSGVRDIRSRPAGEEWIQQRVEQYRDRPNGFHATLLKDGDRFVGHTGILEQEVDGQVEFEISYWLQRRYWGQGFATEAAAFWREYGFQHLDLRRLVSLIVPDNAPSRRVAERIGMTVEKETTFKNRRICVYAISRPA